ncbi:MAG: SHOCT domain-containing protein, partial [Rhodocyclales bacterium]|nr:SHOCT domain-containing protein [Rhodocyclales bacterium]
MPNKLTEAGQKAKEALERALANEHTQDAIAKAKAAGKSLGDEAERMGKVVARSDMAKDAATGAAIGALVAIPIPLIGPIGGAAVGAMLGVYRSITKSQSRDEQTEVLDIHSELLKLDELRQKGIITDAEFGVQKKKLL